MGSETRNARPSAIHFKEKIWRPVAALAVALLAGIVYDEAQPPVNDNQVSTNQALEIKLADQYLDSIPSESKSETSLSGSFSIADLKRGRRALEDQILMPTPKITNQQQLSHWTKISAQIPRVPSHLQEFPESDQSEVVRIASVYESVQGQESQVEEWLLAAGWPQELQEEAKQVIWCESNNIPNIVSPDGLHYGLFQLKKMWFGFAGIDFNLWADPVKNVEVALIVYQYDLQHGNPPWYQWSCKP